MWRLGAEIGLTFDLPGLSYLTKLLVIHTCEEKSKSYNTGGGTSSDRDPQKETYSADHIVFMFSDISLLFFLFYGFFFFYGEILESFPSSGL